MKKDCYAVIFESRRTDQDEGYGEAAVRMLELARQQPGFIDFLSARGADGFGISVSYWESEAAIAAWRDHAEHRMAQERGRKDWYRSYRLSICKVDCSYGFACTEPAAGKD